MKRKIFIYQIYYSKETRSKLDPGFIPLDNTENQRPDWREFWCIKSFFDKNKIDNESFYGFFSPKLFDKTGLISSSIYNFIDQNHESTDIFLFNPIKKSSFVFFNVIDQAVDKHKSITFDIFTKIFFVTYKNEFNLSRLVNHSNSTVYCNHFVANGSFWKKWLKINEFLFDDLEKHNSVFKNSLTKEINHETKKVELKVFIMERIVSIMLACRPDIKRSSYNIFDMPNFKETSFFSKNLFLFLDFLKISYEKNNNKIYKILFVLFRLLIK
jgi:hypothetical protein